MDLSTAPWRTSSYSTASSPQCVEVAALPTGSAVRDTRHRDHATLLFDTAEWSHFITAVKQGEFD